MVKKTIRMYLALTFVANVGGSFIFAMYVMFLLSRGMNLVEVNLINMFFFVTMFICEIPTGIFADVFGRKFSFVCACFILAASQLLYGFSHGFWFFALAEIIGAIGTTFWSGAFQAWLVDKLKYHGYNDSLDQVFAKEQQVIYFARIIGGLSGAYLAKVNIAYPWFASGIVMLACGIVAQIIMKEEYFVQQKFSFKVGRQSMVKISKVSFNFVKNSSPIRFILIIGLAMFFAVQGPNMQWQPFFAKNFGSIVGLGYLFVAISLALIIGARISPWLTKKIGNVRVGLILSQLLIGITILLTVAFKIFPVVLTFFLLNELARGIYYPMKDAYLNNNIPSEERATLISLESISHHLGGMIGLFVTGFLANHYSISVAWWVCGIVLIVSALIVSKNHHKI